MFLQKRTTTSLIPIRLGALLIGANLVRPEYMTNALMIARQTGRKLGEMLVSQSLITADDLTGAIELQKLIKEGSITVELGTRALRIAHDQQCTFRAALEDLGWSDQKTIKAQDLATLLISAGCIKQEHIEQAKWNSAKNNLPLGRNLVLSGHVTPSLLGSALCGLILLRDGLLGFDSVSHALRVCVQKKIPMEEALELKLTTSNHVRVGELLSSAGLLSESDSMTAVEKGLLNQQSIGQVLLETRMVSPLVLDGALKLQQLIGEGKMSRQQASELLRMVASKQVKLDDFLSEMSYLKSRVLDLLVVSELIDEQLIANSLQDSSQQETDIIRALFASGTLSQELFRLAVRCIYDMESGALSESGAVQCLKSQFSPGDSLSEDQMQSA